MPASLGIGNGLVANYYSDSSFSTLAATRIDPSVNFNWAAAPLAALSADGYSVRWTGQVQAQYTETYTFSVTADEGVRLWVNGQKLIDSASATTANTWTGTISLAAGEVYDLKLEYVDRAGASNIKLVQRLDAERRDPNKSGIRR